MIRNVNGQDVEVPEREAAEIRAEWARKRKARESMLRAMEAAQKREQALEAVLAEKATEPGAPKPVKDWASLRGQ